MPIWVEFADSLLPTTLHQQPTVLSRNAMPTTKNRKEPVKAAANVRNSETCAAATADVAAAAEETKNGSRSSPNDVACENDGDGCCCPTGCFIGDPIDPNDPDDGVRVICYNPDCNVGQYMHKVCFDAWESSALTYLRNSGRARNWSEKQLQQNLWTKKGFDVAYKACACKCGHGHMRKDLDTVVSKISDEKRNRHRKRSGGKQIPGNMPNGGGGGISNNLGPRMRSRTLSLGSAAGLFSCSPPNQLAHSLGSAPKKSGSEIDFFCDAQNTGGSIFKRRESMCSFSTVLPRWKINGIHIKMEDDCPQGNDETRIFVLTSLGDQKMREVDCLLCRSSLAVYDRYPLLDGTFFLSPVNHGGIGVKIKHDNKDGFLFAVCVLCLESSSQFTCVRCGSDGWFPGDRLVLGTLYTFDVLASTACCSPACSSCRNQVPVPQTHSFSTFSDPTVCPHCGHADWHFIRRLENVSRVNSASA